MEMIAKIVITKLKNRDLAPISGDVLIGQSQEQLLALQRALNDEGVQVYPRLHQDLSSFWAFRRHSPIGTLMYHWRFASEENAKAIGAVLTMGAGARETAELLPPLEGAPTLRDLRARVGLSQRQLAEAIGVAQPTYCATENGTRRLHEDEGRRIAPLLRSSVEDVMAAAYRSVSEPSGN